jgi:two-component system cell cycle response regulator
MEFQRRSEEAERATGPEPDRPWRSTTGLWREDYVRDILPLEFERAKRYKYPLTCVMLTPDCYEDLAAVEDELAARQLLLDLAQEVRSRLRRCDLCCQIDDRTVLALLPNTSLEGTVTAATRLREVGPSLAQARSEERPITVSIGCYTLAAGNALDADDLLARAREALEEAQQRGGNNACMRGGYRWDLAGDGGGQSRSRPGTSC